MKIAVKANAKCGDAVIPPGDYVVSLNDQGQIQLTGHGQDYKVQAIRKPCKGERKVRTTSVNFYSLGGPTWTLAVICPRGEFTAFLTYQ